MNKAIAWLPIAFVLGGLVGFWGPTMELREKSGKFKVAESKSSRRSVAGFDSFASMVNIPDAAKNPRRSRPRQEESVTNQASTAVAKSEGTEPVSVNETNMVEMTDLSEVEPDPVDLQARIDEAKDLWRTRSKIAKAKLFDRLGLDDAGKAKFDAAFEAMNDKIRDSMQAMADTLVESNEFNMETGVRMMGDVCTTLAETYDQLGEVVGTDLRSEISSVQLVDFIDPTVADPLIPVQDKLHPYAEPVR